MVTNWYPWLAAGGPWRERFRSLRDGGVTIADLRRWRTADGGGELSVEFLSGGERPRAERVLERWARLIGYRRLWLPDRIVELEGDALPLAASARADCKSCGASWDDGLPEFWRSVHRSGCFPRTCLLCGGELPQWSLAAEDDPAAGRISTHVSTAGG